jgi:hypothetical protein
LDAFITGRVWVQFDPVTTIDILNEVTRRREMFLIHLASASKLLEEL